MSTPKKYGVIPKIPCLKLPIPENSDAMNELLNRKLRQDALEAPRHGQAGASGDDIEAVPIMLEGVCIVSVALGTPLRVSVSSTRDKR